MADPLGLISGSQGPSPTYGPSHPKPAAQQQGDGPSFKDVLMKNIEQVNALQKDAERAVEDLQSGKRDDLANVLIAKEKADTAFKMLLQVRNKLSDAYEEVKQMRV